MSHLDWPADLTAPAGMGGLKKILRKALPVAAAAAAVATGQPQLAVAAYSTASAATAKKAKLAPPVEALPEPAAGGIFGNLVPADRNALVLGGAVVGGLVLAKLLFRKA